MRKNALLLLVIAGIFCITAGTVVALEILDPAEVEYSTYLGGTGGDQIGNASDNGGGGCVAVDQAQCVYVIGRTSSTDFPTENPYQASKAADDAFISKLSADGSQLIFSTYLGGNGSESGDGIAIDTYYCAYVVGSTGSSNFPTVNAYQSSHGGGNDDVFVTKFSSAGSELLYSTYLGGDSGYNPAEFGYGIAVDSLRHAYVTGYTGSYNFPTVNPYQSSQDGQGDAFVTKFDSTGSSLIFSTYLGGNSDDTGRAIAVDASAIFFGGADPDDPGQAGAVGIAYTQCAYVTGDTSSEDFPTRNCYQATFSGNDDVFVTKFDPDGSSLTFSTYLGGGHFDDGMDIAVDADRNIYITGSTISGDFPVVNAYQDSLAAAGSYDAFVTKIMSPGSPLAFSTYLGGSEDDEAWGIAVYLDDFAFITGYTMSDDFPVENAYQSSFADQTGADAFAAKFSCQGQRLLYSTYLGGNNDDVGKGIAVDTQGSAYIGGTTQSDNFPIENPYQSSRAGSTDAFITKIYQPSLSPVYADGDYNGDGTSDVAIFRPSSGLWAIRGISRIYFGGSTDRVAPGDYNGDGTADPAIFRPASGLWAVHGVTRLYFGSPNDQPAPSDYNGDGACDIAIFRAQAGLWAVRGGGRIYFGADGDVPVPGDYQGTGSSVVGIFRPQDGLWSVRGVTRTYFGRGNDQVASGDYDGDGTWEIGLFRPGAGLWAIKGVSRIYFGNCEDQAVPADYNGDTIDDPGIFRGWQGLWAARTGLRVYFGSEDDIAVTR